MPRILTFIDIFPGYYYDRVNYNFQEKQKSSLGGCSAIFYVMFLLGITVYYAIPVFEMRNPKIQTFQVPTDPEITLEFKEIGPIFFQIQYFNKHYDLNRTYLDIYFQNVIADRDEEGSYVGNHTKRYEVRRCEGITNHWLP